MELKVTRVSNSAIIEKGELFYCDDDGDDIVIAPSQCTLIKTGIKIDVPDGYKLDIELIEDLNDSDIIFLGKSIAPKKMGYELGLIVYNVGRKPFRLDLESKIAIYNLIKLEKFEIGELDD